ncbi:MAG: folate-binding protein, partial [Alphaproteobacteria bacterium]|nr:folate-binding protein [Alphaproteobacteria bacterium]
ERWAEAAAAAGFAIAPDRASYEARRIALGVPDGSRDLVVDKSFVMENGFDELNGIDFDKGCYVGQEVTARMKHRALVRKRLLPVTIDGPPPAPGTPVVQGEAEIGEMRSAADGIGLALLRLDRAFAATAPITAGAARLVARRPDWVRLDERSD